MDIRKAKKLVKGDIVKTKNSTRKMTVANIAVIPKKDGQIEDIVVITCTNGKQFPHKQLQYVPMD